MKLEKQLCSLWFARKLKELGLEQDSLWTWVLGCEEGKTTKYKLVITSNNGFTGYICAGRDNKVEGEMFSAFTIAELGEKLKKIDWRKPELWGFWNCPKMKRALDPNYLARLLIYILEEGFVKVETINK